jgi:hypothetical protein
MGRAGIEPATLGIRRTGRESRVSSARLRNACKRGDCEWHPLVLDSVCFGGACGPTVAQPWQVRHRRAVGSFRLARISSRPDVS